MTEYDYTPEAYEQAMYGIARTGKWVTTHLPGEQEYYSPYHPPTEISDQFFRESAPSEVGSSHSNPPKMLLRYPDGRPDIPIPHPGDTSGRDSRFISGSHGPEDGMIRSKTYSSSRPSRRKSGSRSHGKTSGEPIDLENPEEIKVLPSHGPPSSTHIRSKSLPRNARLGVFTSSDTHSSGSSSASHQRGRSTGLSKHAGPPIPPPLDIPPTPMLPPRPDTSGYSHSHWHAPPMHSPTKRHNSSRRNPPPIVYAPSHHSRQPHYAPPAILNHPPQVGPGGMVFSHSAPPGRQSMRAHQPDYAKMYPVAEDPARSRSRSMTPHRHRSLRRQPINSSMTSLNSNATGSTYYVLPTAGQKVHVIRTPENSIATATSPTQVVSPTSSRSAGSITKTFFRKLRGFADKFSMGPDPRQARSANHYYQQPAMMDSHGHSRRRRHSTGQSGRPMIMQPRATA